MKSISENENYNDLSSYSESESTLTELTNQGSYRNCYNNITRGTSNHNINSKQNDIENRINEKLYSHTPTPHKACLWAGEIWLEIMAWLANWPTDLGPRHEEQ